MEPSISFWGAVLLITCLTTGCGTKSSDRGLSATKWQLKGYVTSENPKLKQVESDNNDQAFMLEFMNNIQTYGWGEKNLIGGKYKVSGSQISFKELIHTRRTTQFQDESIFFNLIENATEYTVDDQELYLYSDQKKSYLLFKRL